MADDVPESLKRERLERLTDLQRAITAERYEARLGRRWTALVDRVDEETELSIARLPWQADDIDGVTYLDQTFAPGTLVEVAANDVVDDYDFHASVVRVINTPALPSATTVGRQLPLVSATIGSFGR
jgi:ribosomal protein S12 methylthiotransferase